MTPENLPAASAVIGDESSLGRPTARDTATTSARDADQFSPLLTLSEVSGLLRLNERTIRRMVAARGVPCVRIGRQLRFAPEALSRWLRAREEG